MKKHINVEDFIQLTEEQQEHLRDIWKPIKNQLFFLKRIADNKFDSQVFPIWSEDLKTGEEMRTKIVFSGLKNYDGRVYPCFTIGDMLELLFNAKITQRIDLSPYEKTYVYKYDAKKCFRGTHNCELCDELWNAVKWCLCEGLI